MDENRMQALAELLLAAETNRSPVQPLTETDAEITVDDAYRVQLRIVEMKKASGQVVVGKKIGLTNKAMQTALGVMEPDYGHLMDAMVVMEGEKIAVAEMLRPFVEGELAFLLKEDLQGPGVTSAEVMRCTEGVIPCLEIVDSRIAQMRIRLQDTVADNAASARLVLGSMVTPLLGIDLRTAGLVLEKNGEVVATAAGAAVLGNPTQAVAWLANKLATYGIPLRKGEIILSGAFSMPVPVVSGDHVRADFGPLGDVQITFS